jgi:hypothetical protein
MWGKDLAFYAAEENCRGKFADVREMRVCSKTICSSPLPG